MSTDEALRATPQRTQPQVPPDDEVDEASWHSFPASDPPAFWTRDPAPARQPATTAS